MIMCERISLFFDCVFNFLNSVKEWICNNQETISFVIDTLCMIATVAAVIVAICANKTSSKSLKYSLKVQEQSKNVDLFDKRVSLAEDLKSGKSISELSLKLLFDDKIFEEYEELKKVYEEKKALEHDRSVYIQNVREPDGAGGFYNPVEDIAELEAKMESYGKTEESKKEFEELCKKHQIYYSESGNPEDTKCYNYSEISEKIGNCTIKAKKQLDKVLEEMEESIGDSISSIKLK